jgi:uncharacterized protein GlcG (DUF336 family)
MKTTQTIDYSEAKQIIDRIVEKALHQKKAAVVAVADSHGELIAFARMDGAPVSSIRIAANKAWTAARERHPGHWRESPASGKGPRYRLLRRSQVCGMGWRHSGVERRRSSRRCGRQRPFVE